MARTIGIYGQSNATKSSQCYHLAKWYRQTYGRKVRYVNADNGEGVKYVIDAGFVDDGWMDTLDLTGRYTTALSDLMKVVGGWWPKNGKLEHDEVNRFNVKDDIGMYIFEGGTSFADLIQRGFSSVGDKKAFNLAYNYQEGEYTFGGIAMQHIGMIQQAIMRAIVTSKRLMGVDYVVWTFHATKSEEKMSKAAMIGPMIIGNSITPAITKELGTLIHLQRETVNGDMGPESRAVAYFADHPDPSSDLPCIAKITILPELIPKWKQKYQGDKWVLSYEQGLAEPIADLFKLTELSRKVGERWKEGLTKGAWNIEHATIPVSNIDANAMGDSPSTDVDTSGVGKDSIDDLFN